MALHVVGFLVVVVTLLATTQNKNSAKYVFTGVENSSGWPDGLAWCIGLLTVVYGFIGFETVGYFAEEVQHASHNVPKASMLLATAFHSSPLRITLFLESLLFSVFWNAIVNAVSTFPFVVTLVFCMDLEKVLASPIGTMSPMTAVSIKREGRPGRVLAVTEDDLLTDLSIQVYINSTGSIAAGIFLNCISTTMAFVSLVDVFGSASRAVFAMARDGLFPSWFVKVSPRFDIPSNAMWLVGVPSGLFPLVLLGNSTAFYGFISGILVGSMLTYAVPIAMMIVRKFQGTEPRGPWHMGRFGLIVNILAMIWVCFLIVVLSWPSTYPVTQINM